MPLPVSEPESLSFVYVCCVFKLSCISFKVHLHSRQQTPNVVLQEQWKENAQQRATTNDSFVEGVQQNYSRTTIQTRKEKKNEKIHTEQNKSNSNSNNNRNWTMSEKWKRRRKCTHKMKKKERIKTVDSIRRSEKYWNDRKKHWGTKLVKTKHEDWGTTALKSIHHALDVVIAVVWLLRTFKWLTNTNAISKLNHSSVNVYLMLS